MIAPHRKNRKRRKTQDGRPLRYARHGGRAFLDASMAAPYCDAPYYPNNFLGFGSSHPC